MSYSDLYSTIYLLLNILGTYIIYRFMNIFFCNVRKREVEMISYVFYYCVIAYFHLYVNKAFINLICNVVLFFLITWNYRSTFKKKILVSLLIYSILLVVESFIVIIISILHLESDDSTRIIGLVAIKIVSLIFVLMLNNVKYVKLDMKISVHTWVLILLFPLGSLILFGIIIVEPTKNTILLSLGILLAFNLLIFHIYEIINKEYFAEIQYKEKKREADLLYQKSIFYEKQLNILNSFQEKIRMIKHNYDNDVLVLESLIKNNEMEEVKRYISGMIVHYEDYGMYSNTDNIAIDSLVNYKLQVAEKMGTELYINIKVPDVLKIEKNDLSIILGCLLDNAIEALEKTNDRRLSISIQYDRSILYINIVNSYSGCIVIENGIYQTSKEDKESHGLGLMSVQRVINKYHGEMIINDVEGVFSVDLMIYDSL